MTETMWNGAGVLGTQGTVVVSSLALQYDT